MRRATRKLFSRTPQVGGVGFWAATGSARFSCRATRATNFKGLEKCFRVARRLFVLPRVRENIFSRRATRKHFFAYPSKSGVENLFFFGKWPCEIVASRERSKSFFGARSLRRSLASRTLAPQKHETSAPPLRAGARLAAGGALGGRRRRRADLERHRHGDAGPPEGGRPRAGHQHQPDGTKVVNNFAAPPTSGRARRRRRR